MCLALNSVKPNSIIFLTDFKNSSCWCVQKHSELSALVLSVCVTVSVCILVVVYFGNINRNLIRSVCVVDLQRLAAAVSFSGFKSVASGTKTVQVLILLKKQAAAEKI